MRIHAPGPGLFLTCLLALACSSPGAPPRAPDNDGEDGVTPGGEHDDSQPTGDGVEPADDAADDGAPVPDDGVSDGQDDDGSALDAGGEGPVEPTADAPRFRYEKVLVYRDKARYNPTDEFIFASVMETTHIANPLGRYYLYYAPHDAPGGISLAYADDIEGPYTEYAQNPLLGNAHQGRFSVTHVSSPHVVWMTQYNKYFLYFHGENTTTRWAHSTDGLSWQLAEDNIALTTAMWQSRFPGRRFSECSYARVFEYNIPGIGDRYTMLMMLIEQGFGRRIGLATSNDGKRFTPRDPALIAPAAGEGTDISGAFYLPHDGRHLVVYHGSSGNLYATDVGARFDQESHQGVFYDPEPHYPEYDKASAPFFFEVSGRLHFFYDVGPRLDQTIALAIQTPTNNVVVDNGASGFSSGGAWAPSTSTEGFYGADYLHDDSAAANQGVWAKWKPSFSQAGNYKVYARWPAHTNRPDRIKYKVYHRGGVSEVFADQTDQNGSWMYLGRFAFDAGSSESGKLTLDAASDSGFAVADAAWFVYDP
jgi:hypothetical protein